MSDQKVLSLSPFMGLALANPGLLCPFEILESLAGLSDISNEQNIPGDNERKKKCFAKKCLRLSKEVTQQSCRMFTFCENKRKCLDVTEEVCIFASGKKNKKEEKLCVN